MSATGRVLGALLIGPGVTLLAGLVAAPASARAPSDEPIDVLIVVDDTASMSDVIEAAKGQIAGTVAGVREQYADSRFGLATVADIDRAWDLRVPLTGSAEEVAAGLQEVVTHSVEGNIDYPEAYARAIHESAGSEVGWRPDARRVVLLVADDMPKDDDINEGIPDDIRLVEGVWRTSSDDDPPENALDWQEGLRALRHDGIVLTVLFTGDPAYLPYWEFWTAEYADGTVTSIEPGAAAGERIGGALTDLIAQGAEAAPGGSSSTGPVLGVLAVVAAAGVAVAAPRRRQRRLVRRHVRVTGRPDATGRHRTRRHRDGADGPAVLIQPHGGRVEHRVLEGAD